MTTRYGADELSRPVTHGELHALQEQFWRSDAARAIARDQHRSFHPELVTKLPVRPPDGYEVYFLADAVAGVIWHFRYNAKSASTYKWEFVGGPPLYEFVETGGTTLSATYVNPGTLPVIAVPFAGVYEVRFGCEIMFSTVSTLGRVAPYFGSTPATDSDELMWKTPSVAPVALHFAASQCTKGTMSVPGNIGLHARSDGSNVISLDRAKIFVSPIRVG